MKQLVNAVKQRNMCNSQSSNLSHRGLAPQFHCRGNRTPLCRRYTKGHPSILC